METIKLHRRADENGLLTIEVPMALRNGDPLRNGDVGGRIAKHRSEAKRRAATSLGRPIHTFLGSHPRTGPASKRGFKRDAPNNLQGVWRRWAAAHPTGSCE